jgi:hypothetical protein
MKILKIQQVILHCSLKFWSSNFTSPGDSSGNTKNTLAHTELTCQVKDGLNGGQVSLPVGMRRVEQSGMERLTPAYV